MKKVKVKFFITGQITYLTFRPEVYAKAMGVEARFVRTCKHCHPAGYGVCHTGFWVTRSRRDAEKIQNAYNERSSRYGKIEENIKEVVIPIYDYYLSGKSFYNDLDAARDFLEENK